MKKLMTSFLALFVVVGLTGCGSSDTSSNDGVSGKVLLNGSTSMEKLVSAFGEVIGDAYPGLELESQFTGSSAGVEAVLNGTADVGNASRALKDSEKEQLVENVVAIDGIAVITDVSNSLDSLTVDQLISIYVGEVTNWSEVGGDDQVIVVIGRESGSGTRGAFEELLGVEDLCNYAQEIDSTGAVVAKVQTTPGAIGYVSLDVLDGSVKALQLDGVDVSVETIQEGTYPLQRPFVMATKGTIDAQNEQVKALFDFIASDAGQEIIVAVGLIPTN